MPAPGAQRGDRPRAPPRCGRVAEQRVEQPAVVLPVRVGLDAARRARRGRVGRGRGGTAACTATCPRGCRTRSSARGTAAPCRPAPTRVVPAAGTPSASRSRRGRTRAGGRLTIVGEPRPDLARRPIPRSIAPSSTACAGSSCSASTSRRNSARGSVGDRRARVGQRVAPAGRAPPRRCRRCACTIGSARSSPS